MVKRRHFLMTLMRLGLLIVIVLIVIGVLTSGDLPVLPAVVLVFLAWALIAVDSLHWLLRSALPVLVTTANTAWTAAWRALAEDPVGGHLHEATSRLKPRARRLRPVARWIMRRFGTGTTGLLLTVSGLTATMAASALRWIGHGVDNTHSSVSRFDLRVSNIASRLELSGQRRIMEAITNIGNTRSVLTLAGLLVIGAVVIRAWRSAALLVGTLATSSLIVTVLKLHHARPRPALGQLVETSTSFPSGHAAASLSLALGVVLWWWASTRRRLALVAAFAVPIGLLIGYSRAYLSIHWLSDVAAGWLVAILATAIVVFVDRLVATCIRSTNKAPRHRPIPIYVVSLLTVISAAVLAVTGRHNFPTRAPTTAPTHLATTQPATLLRVLPRYSETLFERRMEPLGLVIIASNADLRGAIKQAGWTIADPITPGRLLHTYWAGLRGHTDLTAPVTPTFLDTRVEDLAIQQQSLGRGVKARHHARLWRLPLDSPAGCPVWAVTASLDDHVEWTLRTLLPNHHIAPAIDTERDLLANTLQHGSKLKGLGRFRLVGPTLGTNAAGDPFFTDGNIAVLRQPSCR
jgi:membrane-associated phospholipid phosphatase